MKCYLSPTPLSLFSITDWLTSLPPTASTKSLVYTHGRVATIGKRVQQKGSSLVPYNFNPDTHHLDLFYTDAGLLSKTRRQGPKANTVIP